MSQRLANAQALYLEAIRDGNAAAAIEKYSGVRYTQHSTPVRDGKAGFIEFFEDFHRRNPEREVEIVRSFADGNFVFLHVLQTLNNGEFRYVTADIFDTDADGKMIEHWDMIAEVVDETASGRSQLDGATVPINIDQTNDNKDLVRRFLDEVLIGGARERLDEFISPDEYLQHNPDIGDGIDALTSFLDGLADQGQTMGYDKVHLVIGCGDLVAAMSEMHLAGSQMAVIDLYRVSEGLIVEHWDVIEPITPPETWVNSGKF